jgi:hypothetical protein
VAAVAPDYWQPKPVMAKANKAKSTVVNASEKSKVDEKQ